jgi:hypothetical protein
MADGVSPAAFESPVSPSTLSASPSVVNVGGGGGPASVSDVSTALRVLASRTSRVDAHTTAALAGLKDAADYLKEKAAIELEFAQKLEGLAKRWVGKGPKVTRR